MATAAISPDLSGVGQTAGEVWKTLSKTGPLSLAKLVKAVGEPRDTVMQALGWLAREEKIVFAERGRTRIVGLRDD